MTDWRWKFFSEAEMRCRCGCGRCEMDPGFMDELESLRLAYGKPLKVNRGYSCPARNAKVSTTGESGPHTTGRAVDLAVSGGWVNVLLAEATKLKFTGIGLKQHGPHEGRFLHLDTIHEGPRPNTWTYP